MSSQPDFCSKPSDFRQPIDVVEAALDVAAMLGGRALVAELRPQLFLVVERDNKIGANLLEKVGLLDALQQHDAVGLPWHLNVGNLVLILRVLIETSNAIFKQRLNGGVLPRPPAPPPSSPSSITFRPPTLPITYPPRPY